MSNTSKSCIYWREVNTVKYGEYIVIEMVGKLLLEEYNSTERQGKGERNSDIIDKQSSSKETLHNKEIGSKSVDIAVIDFDDTDALGKQSTSMSTSNDTEIDGIDLSLVTIIDVDSICLKL